MFKTLVLLLSLTTITFALELKVNDVQRNQASAQDELYQFDGDYTTKFSMKPINGHDPNRIEEMEIKSSLLEYYPG